MRKNDFWIAAPTRHQMLVIQGAMIEYINRRCTPLKGLVTGSDFPCIGGGIRIGDTLWKSLAPDTREKLYLFGLGVSVGLGNPL